MFQRVLNKALANDNINSFEVAHMICKTLK